MIAHKTSGRWKLGIVLTLIAAFFWGSLPIAIRGLVTTMDGVTITWYRFLGASIIFAAFIRLKYGWPAIRKQNNAVKWLLAAATVGLCGNYVTYAFGCYYLTPSATVIVMQLSPIFFLLLSVWVFKEAFNRIQAIGLIIVIAGQALFFNQRLGEMFLGITDQSIGVILIFISAWFWAGYGLAQKQLLKTYPSASIVMLICMGCFLLLLPVARPSSVSDCSTLQLAFLFFGVINTVFGYSAFAEALNHLEASRVSAVLTVVPLFTIVLMKFGHTFFPGVIEAESLNLLSVLGAVSVIAGSTMCALVRDRKPRSLTP